jgi:nicotinamide riboside transporter PnuC
MTFIINDLFRYYGLDWLWYSTSILAVYLLGNKNKLGFVIMIISDIAGLAMAYLTQSSATLVGSLIYLTLNIRGWYAWRADEKHIKKAT